VKNILRILTLTAVIVLSIIIVKQWDDIKAFFRGARHTTVEINDREWHGVSNKDLKKAIVGKIRDHELNWWIRYDHDDNRKYLLYAENVRTNRTFNEDIGSTYTEWKLCSGQSRTNATVDVYLVPYPVAND